MKTAEEIHQLRREAYNLTDEAHLALIRSMDARAAYQAATRDEERIWGQLRQKIIELADAALPPKAEKEGT